MTYDPEQTYNNHLEHVLKKIKSLELHAAEGDPLEFIISTVIGGGYPSGREERSLLRKLKQMGAIASHKKQWFEDNFEKAPRYFLQINKQEFDNLYKKIGSTKSVNPSSTQIPTNEESHVYDVVFSLAGEQKKFSQEIKDLFAESGLNCWIYTEQEAELAGADLTSYLQDLFMKQSKFCLIIISQDYVKKIWTGLERQYIFSKWMKDNKYIIPVDFDGSKLPGLPDTIGYIPLNGRTANQIAEIILDKIKNKGNLVPKPIVQNPTYPIPRFTKSINYYKEKDIWIAYIVRELKERVESIEGMEFYSSIEDGQHIRILVNDQAAYSLNIATNLMGSEKGLSFYGTTGDISIGNRNSSNAFGEFVWSKEKNEVVIDLMNLSLFPTIGEKKQYAKNEFVDKLWEELVGYLDKNY